MVILCLNKQSCMLTSHLPTHTPSSRYERHMLSCRNLLLGVTNPLLNLDSQIQSKNHIRTSLSTGMQPFTHIKPQIYYHTSCLHCIYSYLQKNNLQGDITPQYFFVMFQHIQHMGSSIAPSALHIFMCPHSHVLDHAPASCNAKQSLTVTMISGTSCEPLCSRIALLILTQQFSISGHH